MGEEYYNANPSWKKMVITKNTNNWTSTMKSDDVNIPNAPSYNVDEHVSFCEVKLEADDGLIVGYEETVHSESLSPKSYAESDDSGGTRRKRRSSGSKHESPEERAARLYKMSEYAAKRLATETPDQRASRLRRMSEYAAKRLAQETSDQRAKRLARMSAYAAKRLAKESPEQRQARLARMSAYAAKRQAMKKEKPTNVNNGDEIQRNLS